MSHFFNNPEYQGGLEDITRRHFFSKCAMGLGGIALSALMSENRIFAADQKIKLVNPLEPKAPPYKAKAKNVIYLFMAGGPSQLELFDYKPDLVKYNGQPIPKSYIEGKRFAFMDSFAKDPPKLLGTRRKFAQHGNSGAYVSE